MKEWNTISIGKVCKLFTDGNWIESKDQSSDGIRLVQTGNVGIGEFKDRREKARWISDETFDRLKCQEIIPGDCLVSRLPDPVGRACIIPETGDKMITAVDCSILRFDQSTLIPEFFSYFAQTKEYLINIESKCTGATRKRISRKNLGTIPIPLPPPPEQKRIIAILDDMFAGITKAVTNAEKNLANTREMFESYLNQVFTQKGEGWGKKKLIDLCHQITVGHVGSMASKYTEQGIPFLRSQNVQPFRIVLDNIKYIDDAFNSSLSKSSLSPGDVVIVRTGYPGTAAVIPQLLPLANCSDLVIARPKDKLNPYFLAAVMNSVYGKNTVGGNLVGAAQKHFNVSAAKNMIIAFPALKEQCEIVHNIERFQIETKRLETIYRKKLSALAELKQSILQKAFTGELTADNATQPLVN